MRKLLIIGLLFFLVAVSFAQQTAPAAISSVTNQEKPVMLDGKVLFTIGGIKATTADARAKAISERIEKLAKDLLISPQSISTEDDEITSDVIAGDKVILSILDRDAAPHGRTRQDLTKEYAGKIRVAVDQYRRDHSVRNILIGVLLSVLSTSALILVLFLLTRFFRKLDARILIWMTSKSALHFQALQVVLKGAVSAIVKAVQLLVVLWFLYFYLNLVLSFFPWTRPYAVKLLEYVLDPLRKLGTGFVSFLPNLFFLGVLFLITRYALRVTRSLFDQIESGSVRFAGFYQDWAHPTYNLVRILVIAMAAVVAFPYIPGSSSPAFQGLSIFLGVLFSLGSSSAIANVVAGVILTYMRPFKVGDLVQIGEKIGSVVGVTLLVTRVRTAKNEEITFPNSLVLGAHVTNYSSLASEKGLILHTQVTIGYDVPWRQVEALLLLAAEKTEGVLRDPAPFVLQRELGDFYVSYELNAYTGSPAAMLKTYSELHRNILDAFNEYGVQITSPNYEADPERPKVVPKDQWFAAPAKKEDRG